MATAAVGWTFTPFPPFPSTLFPNTAVWNINSEVKNRTYQVQISWPFQWESPEVTDKSALALYILDGNANGLTAHDAVRRRQPLASNIDPSNPQPDTVVVSIGYPLTSSVYDFVHRFQDFSPPYPTQWIPEAHGDEFLEFVDGTLRPWVRDDVFPGVKFGREGVYGHSFGGLWAVWAMLEGLKQGGQGKGKDKWGFDTYISASPAVEWRNGTLLQMVSDVLGDGTGIEDMDGGIAVRDTRSSNWAGCATVEPDGKYVQPSLLITYGSLEQFPIRRRTETKEQFQTRKDYFQPLCMTDYVHELFDRVQASGRLRDVTLKEYVGQDHSGVAGTSIMDGIEYFLDWSASHW